MYVRECLIIWVFSEPEIQERAFANPNKIDPRKSEDNLLKADILTRCVVAFP
jgi:hypothetical protein